MKELLKFKDHCSWGELLGPAMKITEQEAADHYLESAIQFGMKRHGMSYEKASHWMKENLGYYAGYYSAETMQRVNQLFQTTHPVFGGKVPTPTEALQAGQNMARAMKGEK